MGRQDHSDPEMKAATPVDERRRFPRHECRVEAQVCAADSALRVKGTVTDLSIGGCYVEMLSPLLIDTEAELLFSIESSTLDIRWKVRTSQPGFGMGLAFTEMGASGRTDVREIAAMIERGTENDNPKKPRSLTGPESGAPLAALEVFVRVLLREGIITKEELAQELEKSEG